MVFDRFRSERDRGYTERWAETYQPRHQPRKEHELTDHAMTKAERDQLLRLNRQRARQAEREAEMREKFRSPRCKTSSPPSSRHTTSCGPRPS